MKVTQTKNLFSKIIVLLAKQNPEEKLRIAFQLTEFVDRLRREGSIYEKANKGFRSGATA